MEYHRILCHVCRTQNTLHNEFCSACGSPLSQQYNAHEASDIFNSNSDSTDVNHAGRHVTEPPSIPPPPPPPSYQPNNEYASPYQPNNEYASLYQSNNEYASPYQSNNEYASPYQPKTEYAPPYQPKTEYAPPYQPKTEYAPPGIEVIEQPQVLNSSLPKSPMNSTILGILKALGVLGILVSAGLLGIGILGLFMMSIVPTNYAFIASELWVWAFFIIVGWILLRISLSPFRKPMKSNAPVSVWHHIGIDGGIFLGGAMALVGVAYTLFLIYTYYFLNHRVDLYSDGIGGSILNTTSGLYILLNSRLKSPKIDFSQRQEAIALIGSLLGASFWFPGLLMILSFVGGTMVAGAILLVVGGFLAFITRIRKKPGLLQNIQI